MKINDSIFIFEFKNNNGEKSKAINQIIDNQYLQKFQFTCKEIWAIGINCNSSERNIVNCEKYKLQ